MSTALVEHLLGSQEPTHKLVIPPERVKKSYGAQAVSLCEMVGLHLDPWQQQLLIDGLAVVDGYDAAGNPAERWGAFEVGVELSRQNGKSVVFIARVLAGMFLLDEKKIVYSAHENETAKDAFDAIRALIESNPALLAKIKQTPRSNGFRTTNGQIQIEMWSGTKVKFRTRTTGGGRGLSGDCVILDEAQDLTDAHVAALMPVVSARPNAQLWYGGSAGTRKSVVQGRLIRRALACAERIVMYRWAGGDNDDPGSPLTWAKLNPSFGIRLHPDTIASEYGAMAPDKFGQERLGIGDYPRAEGEDWVIPRLDWEKATDDASIPVGKVMFAVEVKWDRTRASISVAGDRRDGRRHIEVLRNEVGTMWTISALRHLTTRWPSLGVMVDPHSPAASLIGPLEDAGITVHSMKTADNVIAFGSMYDRVVTGADPATGEPIPPQMLHRGGAALTAMLAEAQTRDSGGATTWRRATTADCTGLLGCCWASHGMDVHSTEEEPPPPPLSAADDDATGSPHRGGDVMAMGF